MSDSEKFSAARVREILAKTKQLAEQEADHSSIKEQAHTRSVDEILEKAKKLGSKQNPPITSTNVFAEKKSSTKYLESMPSRRSVPGRAPPVVRWIADGILEIIWVGEAGEWDVAEGLRLLEHVAGELPVQYVVANCEQMTNYSVDVRGPAKGILAFMRNKESLALIGVMPGASVRMIASVLSLAVGMKIKFVDTRVEMLKLLKLV